jgi:hypothetical protein
MFSISFEHSRINMPNSPPTMIAIFESGRRPTNSIKWWRILIGSVILEVLWHYKIAKVKIEKKNTKIILRNELTAEESDSESAYQHLPSDDRNSLDKGETIDCSNFPILTIPIKIPLFEDILRNYVLPRCFVIICFISLRT